MARVLLFSINGAIIRFTIHQFQTLLKHQHTIKDTYCTTVLLKISLQNIRNLIKVLQNPLAKYLNSTFIRKLVSPEPAEGAHSNLVPEYLL